VFCAGAESSPFLVVSVIERVDLKSWFFLRSDNPFFSLMVIFLTAMAGVVSLSWSVPFLIGGSPVHPPHNFRFFFF